MEKATDLLSSSQSFFSLKSLKLKTKQQELLLRISILGLVYILAFITRLFSVLRYESMIHEFDPYFNYRTTLYLTQKGFYEFWNWFDSESWYPLGRIIGGTLYPGLMVTAAFIYWILRFLRFAVHIREVCVLTAPFFASNTTLVAYFFGKELWDTGAGLVAAALIAICPGYISRSVAGSYDNEGVAIFALLLTFYLFVKAVKTGSLAWSLGSALGYFYMVSAWGGYVFIINLIPLYVLVLLVVGRYSMRLYVAYNCMYILGMLLAMQIRFVGFQHVQSGEHMAAMGVFFLMQVFYFLDWVKHLLNDQKLFQAFLRITLTCAISVGVIALGVGTASGYISPWTGRFYSLLDPTYAKDHIPIIASVSEHQPTAWSSFMFDFHILLILFPAGLYFCFKRLSDATIFIVMYGLTSMYFAGVMVRLILVATPAVCLISAIAVSATIKNLSLLVRAKTKPTQAGSGKGTTSTKASSKGALDQSLPYQKNGAIALLVGAFYLLTRYAIHCTWVTSEAYSSPSIVLAARGAHGNRVIFDDYREAYFWLRQNTPQDAKVMSWWDYGYQITAMGNRTVIVDNSADEFPFDDCSDIFSDAETGGSEDDVNLNQSVENDNLPLSSLRHRRPFSFNDSGNESTNFRPFISSESYSNSRERKINFSRKFMAEDNDKNGILDNIGSSNSMQLDLSTKSQKGIGDEQNKEIPTGMNANSVIIDNSNEDSSLLKEDSVITHVNNDEIDNSEEVNSHLREIDDSSSNILFDLANLVIKSVGYQVNMLITIVSLMIKLFTFPVWIIYCSYMFVMDPFQIMRRVKRYVLHRFMRSFGFVFENTLKFVSRWLKEQSSVWRLGLQLGWGCLWSVYVCFVLVGLLVSAFIMGGILIRIMVEEPIRMNEPLNFDYTAKSPVAYVPIIRSPGVTCGVDSQVEVGMVDGVRVIPPNHKLQVTVSLMLPESDYNRNLGIFQVRVDFLTSNGKVLSSARRPCMLQFKSNPIRLFSTFLKAAPLVTGYTSESQKLKVDLKGFSEGFIPTACLRVIIEQRAEFHPGGGVPEIYTASLTLESELPFIKRMLWYWKTTLFVWVSMTLFTMEFLFALLCCKPLIIPSLRLRHHSTSRTGSPNNAPIGR